MSKRSDGTSQDFLASIELDQQRMLMAMDNQKKIMVSLKVERRMTTMVNDQWVLLQAVPALQVNIASMAHVSPGSSRKNK
jgi:hypothetical protein